MIANARLYLPCREATSASAVKSIEFATPFRRQNGMIALSRLQLDCHGLFAEAAVLSERARPQDRALRPRRRSLHWRATSPSDRPHEVVRLNVSIMPAGLQPLIAQWLTARFLSSNRLLPRHFSPYDVPVLSFATDWRASRSRSYFAVVVLDQTERLVSAPRRNLVRRDPAAAKRSIPPCAAHAARTRAGKPASAHHLRQSSL